MQIEKALITDRSHILRVSRKFYILNYLLFSSYTLVKFVIFLKSGLLFSISYWLLWTKFLRCSDLKLKQLWIRNFQGLLFVLKRPFFCFLNNFQYCILNLLLSMYFIIWKIGYHTQICFKGVSKDCLVSTQPYVVVGGGIRFLFFGKIIHFVLFAGSSRSHGATYIVHRKVALYGPMYICLI